MAAAPSHNNVRYIFNFASPPDPRAACVPGRLFVRLVAPNETAAHLSGTVANAISGRSGQLQHVPVDYRGKSLTFVAVPYCYNGRGWAFSTSFESSVHP